ncbi:MAG: iron-containing alcohol dehydrogenase [Planctomycetaceae bacterium]|nr:iron-containing alcohol dehydrogenase [Planctomycetaceae bacterium]
MGSTFLAPPEILFGPDESRKTLDVARRFGSRVFLVTGARSFDALPISRMFAGLKRWTVSGEPDVATVDEGVRLCGDSDVVVAVGGGSVLDSAKAVAGVAANGGCVRNSLEQVGDRKLTKTPLPFIAVPTTAGSGSEATKNAVIRVPDLKVKRSIRHDLLMPRAAIVDPTLAAAAPREVAASSALDAFTHLLEGYVSTGAQATTDALALPGLALAAEGLRGIAAGRDAFASMSQASLWGGLVLANAGLGAVHGLVAPLGGRCAIAHGIGCACLLADTVRVNLQALRSRAPDSPALGKYEKAARALGLASIDDLLALLAGYRRTFDLPRLASKGLAEGDVAPIIQASRGGSMRFNPIELSDAELESIVRSAT